MLHMYLHELVFCKGTQTMNRLLFFLLFSYDMGVNRDVVYNFILLCFCQLTERRSEKIINYSRERGNWEQ